MHYNLMKVHLFFIILNIVVTSYLIYLVSSFHTDLKSVKHNIKVTTNFVKDVWGFTKGSLPTKINIAATRGQYFKDWVSKTIKAEKYKEFLG